MKKIILTLTVWMTSVVFIYAEDITIQEETFWQEIGTRSLTIYPITDDEVTLLFEETQQNVSIQITDSAGHLYFVSVFSGDAYTISLKGMPQREYCVSLQKESGEQGELILLKK